MRLEIINGDWERLIDDNGEVICQGHKLDAEDVLFALGYEFDIDEIEEYEEEEEE